MNVTIQLPNRKKQTVRASWNGERGEKRFNSKSLNEELDKFDMLVKEYEAENRSIKQTIAAFNTVKTNPKSSDLLINNFRRDLSQLSKNLDFRKKSICRLERKYECERGIEFFANDKSNEKNKVMVENQNLIAQALEIERKSIFAKLKLRLFHDHRDHVELSRKLSKIKTDEDIFNDEVEKQIIQNKVRIHTLKSYIIHEQNRAINNYMLSEEDYAATRIQKVWRGYQTRRVIPQVKDELIRYKKTQKFEYDTGEPFPELERSDDSDGSEQKNI